MELLGHGQSIHHVLTEIPGGLAGHGYAQCVFTGQFAQNAHQGAVFAAAVAIDDALAMGILQGKLDKGYSLF